MPPEERRINRVNLARLSVADLLALLGLPEPQRRELRGRPSLRARREAWEQRQAPQ